jgi:hypothetical protein|tara:strand:- start:8 stop:697 length:690 start_codon:yes stop_codon:yes gene_type:complete
MKISKETLEVLKNFSAINPNLVICEGSKLSTIADAKNIMAAVNVSESFPKKVGIYDLNEFLSALSLIEDPEFEFGDSAVSIKSNTATLTYRYADTSILTSPEKEVNMPPTDVEVNLTADDIAQIRRAGSALNHPVVSITTEHGDDAVYLQVKDPNNSSANVYSHKVCSAIDSDTIVDQSFDYQFLIANLKLIPGDYKVAVSSKLISNWECINNTSVKYWIALEKTSVTK